MLGQTPIHSAILEGHINTIKRLVHCGAQLNISAKNGNTLLDSAMLLPGGDEQVAGSG
jgi:ankyrin repeat protein